MIDPQESPTLGQMAGSFAILTVFSSLFLGGLVAWHRVLTNRSFLLKGWRSSRCYAWRWFDLLVILYISGILILLAQFVTLGLMALKEGTLELSKKLTSEELSASGVASGAVGRVAAFVVGLALFQFFCRCSAKSLGWDLSEARSDAGLAAIGFFLLALPVFGLNAAMSSLTTERHPLIDKILSEPDAAMLAASAIATVVAAPLFEEFIFRGLLLSWLLSMGQRAVLDGSDSPEEASVVEQGASPRWAWGSNIVVSLLFALVHIQYGLSSIPLFFFSLMLGHLFVVTGRVVPCVIAHALLNGTSMLTMWIIFLSGNKPIG